MSEERMDFHYLVDVDYDSSRSNCSCDGYCRCSRITNVKINPITEEQLQEIVKYLCNKYKIKDAIHQYGIDRIVHLLKMYDTNKYEINVGSGYYGEEIRNVFFNNDKHLEKMIDKLLKSAEPVEYLLELEYSNVLPCLENLKWEIKEVPFEKVRFGQKYHMMKIQCDNPYDGEVHNIIGITTYKTGYYQLWDGYHRYAAAKEQSPETVCVLVGRKK